uniref:Uncharacterized protein n=1 Tax=Rhizophora mucronata TaxID=61149 RepID=A0A2P2NTG8_RHIMU
MEEVEDEGLGLGFEAVLELNVKEDVELGAAPNEDPVDPNGDEDDANENPRLAD